MRDQISPPARLLTPTKSALFVLEQYDQDGLVLLLGAQQTWTKIPWQALEELCLALTGKGWMKVSGSGFSTEITEGTVDGILKQHVQRATAGWVVAVLERAGVLQLDRSRPLKAKLAMP